MNGWQTVIVAVVSAALTGGGAAAMVNALARRRVTRVEAAAALNESTLEWATQLKDDSSDARKEAHEARIEAREARREMAAVRHEAELLAQELRRLRLAILDPFMTIDRLRSLIGDTGSNGVASHVNQ